MALRIVAFDLGINFAWADDPWNLRWELWKLEGNRPERLRDLSDRLDGLFRRRLDTIYDAVFYERPFARGQAATRSLWGMAGIIEAAAVRAGLPVVDMPPATIKKFITGSGKASKEDMIEAARKFGYTGSNEHEADAICALKYAEAHITTGKL